MARTQQRAVALSAARWYLHHMHINPLDVSAEVAHAALDDFARCYPATVGVQWYLTASEDELRLFYRVWKVWQREQRQMVGLSGKEARYR